ncbi:hypothetical protein SAMN02910456_02518 [Ruminococcaceae bacterium YRB3002]|nr:hypothetical protein SAMN02910456_02518 [Ruminococcaceae bacterium YRB3002]
MDNIYDNTIGKYCPMDTVEFYENLRLASSSYTAEPYRVFSTSRIDFLLDNFAMIFVAFATDSSLRSTMIGVIDNERRLYRFSEGFLYQAFDDIGYKPDEDHITIDINRCDNSTLDMIISRIANSYSKLLRSEVLDALLSNLDPEEANEVGYIGSSFILLLSALEHSDELFGVFKDVINLYYKAQETRS